MNNQWKCPKCGSSYTYVRLDKTIVCRRCGSTTPPAINQPKHSDFTTCSKCGSPKMIFQSRTNAYLCRQCGELTQTRTET